MSDSARTKKLIAAARELSARVGKIKFSPPAAHVGNPLDYAREPHELFLQRFGAGKKRVVFLGMNPGPFGMAQTGVPFGEVAAVRDWLKISAPVSQPKNAHPKRPVTGFACTRSEVSGKRLWGLFAARFGAPENFFKEHFVVNFCPLVFCDEGGRNVTPDKLSASEQEKLFAACDEHLRRVVEILEPEWVVGVGAFAKVRAELALGKSGVKFGLVLHPSPASPAANRGWAAAATRQLAGLGVWV